MGIHGELMGPHGSLWDFIGFSYGFSWGFMGFFSMVIVWGNSKLITIHYVYCVPFDPCTRGCQVLQLPFDSFPRYSERSWQSINKPLVQRGSFSRGFADRTNPSFSVAYMEYILYIILYTICTPKIWTWFYCKCIVHHVCSYVPITYISIVHVT